MVLTLVELVASTRVHESEWPRAEMLRRDSCVWSPECTRCGSPWSADSLALSASPMNAPQIAGTIKPTEMGVMPAIGTGMCVYA